MSYKSKRTVVSIVTGIAFLIVYTYYALGRHAPAPDNLKSWAVTMLVSIGIGVVVSIVVQIVFHLLFSIGVAIKEQGCDDKKVERMISSLMVEDEMDKLIGLKSARIGYFVTVAGFILALVALVTGLSAVMALHILFGAFAIGAIMEGVVSVYLYEKGVLNG